MPKRRRWRRVCVSAAVRCTSSMPARIPGRYLAVVAPVFQDDTADTLAARILAKEHKTYPAALQLLAEGRLRIQDRRVLIDWDGRRPRSPRDSVVEWQEIKDSNRIPCEA